MTTSQLRIGFGTWPFTGDDAANAVASAIDAGYRLVDTAAKYENEDGVGRGIAASGVARDELFIQSKLRGAEHGEARQALERSLERLGLDYLDSYLIHWPLPMLGKYADAWAELVQAHADGLVRHIGVSNFLPEHLDVLVERTGVVPAVNQIQCDPTMAKPELRAELVSRGIQVQAWRPLGKGAVLDHPVVIDLATKRGCTAGQLVLAWHLAEGNVPIARSGGPERQRENLAAQELELEPDELAALAELPQHDEPRFDPRTHEEY